VITAAAATDDALRYLRQFAQKSFCSVHNTSDNTVQEHTEKHTYNTHMHRVPHEKRRSRIYSNPIPTLKLSSHIHPMFFRQTLDGKMTGKMSVRIEGFKKLTSEHGFSQQ